MHATEGKCKECRLFITVMIGLQDQWMSTSGIGTSFHLGLQTSKGHLKDKYTHKAEICKHTLPSGIIQCANLYKYVYMFRFSHLSYKLRKYTFTHAGICGPGSHQR